MANIDKFIKRPTVPGQVVEQGRFERFNLKENPFPSTPIINKDAEDSRLNGQIFEMTIREKEYNQIEQFFLKIPQSDPNHLRLGYIIDTSYIGRGNGKSAFLINLQKIINNDFNLDVSKGINKCFALYTDAEPSGRTKTFDKLVDLIFYSIYSSGIIANCLASLRLEAILNLDPNFDINSNFANSDELIEKLNSKAWFEEQKLELASIISFISDNGYIKKLPKNFPIYHTASSFFPALITEEDFQRYYVQLRRPKERLDFVFSQLVDFFRSSGFNGAYVFIDDFERIPDFQSARQKRDFALELRTCLFDGLYTNAKIGFYNFFLVLHAGVPRLIQEAWSDSGMENRAPISFQGSAKHIIPFEKLTSDHAKLLIKKYLSEFRIDTEIDDKLYPFTEEAVNKIAEFAELNAAKILKTAYEILDRVATNTDIEIVDEKIVASFLGDISSIEDKPAQDFSSTETTDLIKKAKGKE